MVIAQSERLHNRLFHRAVGDDRRRRMTIVKYLPPEVIRKAEGLFDLMNGLPVLLAPHSSRATSLGRDRSPGLSLLFLIHFWPHRSDWDTLSR